jgi:hypothetical protein
MKKVVDQLQESGEQKVASNPLFQWHTLRRLSREDLKLSASAANNNISRSGAEQIEYAACSLLKDEDARAQVCETRRLQGSPCRILDRLDCVLVGKMLKNLGVLVDNCLTHMEDHLTLAVSYSAEFTFEDYGFRSDNVASSEGLSIAALIREPVSHDQCVTSSIRLV